MDVIEIATKLIPVIILSLVLNIPLGIWGSTTKKFSLAWFASIHLAVPIIYLLRIINKFPYWTVIVFIASAVLGQIVGRVLAKYLIKKQGGK